MSNYTFLDITLKDLACRLIPGYGCSNTILQTGLECNIPGENEPYVDYSCVLNIDIQNETSYFCNTCLNQTMDSLSNNTLCSFSFKLNLVTIIFESALKSLWLRLPSESCDFYNIDTLTCYNDFFNRTLYIDDSLSSVNSTVYENFTCSWNFGNGTDRSFSDQAGYDWSFLFVIVFIVAGGLGNILVCLAVCLDKRLQNVTNYFLLSLAIADLLVSLFVMPMGAIPGFLGYWPLGVVWCNIYVTCDVLACSASIMHMCFISIGSTMSKWFKKLFIYLMYVFYAFGERYQKKTYFAVEHPRVSYIDMKHITFANISSYRYSRKDPVYYFNLEWYNTYAIGDNYTFHFYFYQFLTNVYKPSFVEIHFKGCNKMIKDPIFGAAMLGALRKVDSKLGCPVAPGKYNMQNCTLDATVLTNFPFQKGRIIANMTYNPTDLLVADGYIDFAIKEMKVKN